LHKNPFVDKANLFFYSLLLTAFHRTGLGPDLGLLVLGFVFLNIFIFWLHVLDW